MLSLLECWSLCRQLLISFMIDSFEYYLHPRVCIGDTCFCCLRGVGALVFHVVDLGAYFVGSMRLYTFFVLFDIFGHVECCVAG